MARRVTTGSGRPAARTGRRCAASTGGRISRACCDTTLPRYCPRSGRATRTRDQCPHLIVQAALAIADDRDPMMIRLGAYEGMRRGEIAAVHADDLQRDLTGWSLRVLGKGQRVRLLPLLDDVAADLLARLTGWMFPGRVNEHLSPCGSGSVSRVCWGTAGPRTHCGTASVRRHGSSPAATSSSCSSFFGTPRRRRLNGMFGRRQVGCAKLSCSPRRRRRKLPAPVRSRCGQEPGLIGTIGTNGERDVTKEDRRRSGERAGGHHHRECDQLGGW